MLKLLWGKGCRSGKAQQPNYTRTMEDVPTISPRWLLSCPGRREGPQKAPYAHGGARSQRPTSSGSTSKAGHPGGITWGLSTWPGPAGAAGNTHVLSHASAAAICPGYADTCENVMLFFKMSIIVPVLREEREGRGGPSLFKCRACLFFVMLGGENYFYWKPYVEHQQMHILWSWVCCKRDYNAGNL